MATINITKIGDSLSGTLDNIASETTLKEIANSLKEMVSKISGGASNIVTGATKSANQTKTSAKAEGLDEDYKAIFDNFAQSSEAADGLGGSLSGLVGNAEGVSGGFGALLSGGGLEGVALGLAELIPGLGEAAFVAELLYKGIEDAWHILVEWTNTLEKTNLSGAAFNNNILEMRSSAAAAGLGLKEFSEVVTKNSESLAQLGGSVTEGAEKFSRITNITIKEFGDSLGAMGVGLEQYAQELPAIIALQTAGAAGRKNNDEDLAKGAHSLFVEMDGLAKITGKSRSEQEEELKKSMAEAAYKVKLASMDEATRQKTIAAQAIANAQGPAAAEAFKDAVLGIVPSANSLAGGLNSASPQMTGAIRKLAADTRNGSQTLDQFNASAMDANANLSYLGAKAGEANETLSSAAVAGHSFSAATDSMIKASNGVTLANQQYIGMSKEQIQQSQARAIAEQKTQNATAIATGKFHTFLALMHQKLIDGVLNPIMEVVITVGSAIMTWVMPAFEVLVDVVVGIVKPLAAFADMLLKVIGFILKPFALVRDALMAIWHSFRDVISYVEDVFIGIFNTVGNTLTQWGDVISNWLSPIFKALGNVGHYLVIGLEFVVDTIKTTVSMLSIGLQMIVANLKNELMSIWDGIVSGIMPSIDMLKDTFNELCSTISEAFKPLSDAWDSIENELMPIIDTLKDSFVELWGMISEAFKPLSDLFGGAQESGDMLKDFSSGFKKVIDFLGTYVMPVLKVFGWIIGTVLSIPFKTLAVLIQGLILPIKLLGQIINAAAHPIDTAKKVSGAVLSGAKSVLGFAEGTVGSGSIVRDFGAGQPAMLHGKEAVLTEKQLGGVVDKVASVATETVNEPTINDQVQSDLMGEMLKHLSQMSETLLKSHRTQESLLKASI